MKLLSKVLVTAFFSTASGYGLAFPEWGKVLEAPAADFTASDAYDYEGIVALSNCSGSLVKFDDATLQDQGLILTNGHCVSMIAPGKVLYQQTSRKSFTILSPTASRLGKVTATQLVYGTMTDTDLAIYKLRETYQQIQDKFNVEALTLSREYVQAGTGIEVISGYWRRGYSCEAEAIVHSLKEGNWLFKDSIRYSRPGCEVIGGTSGSPVIQAGTRVVVGVNNTINERGSRCQVNNPCEIDKEGTVTYEKGIGYGQQTSWLYSCRNEDGAIDLSVTGCLLPKP